MKNWYNPENQSSKKLFPADYIVNILIKGQYDDKEKKPNGKKMKIVLNSRTDTTKVTEGD